MNKKNTLSPDTALKDYWRDNRRFADFINHAFVKEKFHIKSEKLQEADTEESTAILIDEELEELIRRRDTAKYYEAALILLITMEHQMKIHYAMPVRLMLNDSLYYLKQCRELENIHKDKRDFESADEFLSGMKKEDRLNGIFNIVIYYGDKEWDGPHKLSDMLEIPAALLPYFNDYKIFVLSARDIDPNLFEHKDNQDFFQMIQEFYSSKGRIQKKKFMEKYAGMNIWWETLAALGAVTGYKGLLKKAVENKGGNITMCNALLDWEMEITEEVTNKNIKKLIRVLRKAGVEDSFIAESLKEEYLLSEEQVKEYL